MKDSLNRNVLRRLEDGFLTPPDDIERECDICGCTYQQCDDMRYYGHKVICIDCLLDEGLSFEAIMELKAYDGLW